MGLKEDIETLEKLPTSASGSESELTGLLACPWCGSKPKLEHDKYGGNTCWYGCPNDICPQYATASNNNEARARELWNMRAG